MAKTNALTEWLGISLGEQPPNHYRLLSLKLFASDRGKIDAAAENAIDRVRKNAGEKNKAVAGKLIGMINAARDCLLNADSKSVYDKKLRDSGGAARAVGDSLPEPLELEQIIKTDESSSSRRSRSNSASILLPTVGGAVVALLVYVFAFSGLLDGEKEDGKKPAGQQLANNGKDSTPTSLPAKSKPKSKKPAKTSTAAKKTRPPVKIAGKTTSTGTGKKVVTGDGKKNTAGSPVSVKPVPTPLAKTVDLLKLIDPKKNTISGTWEFEGNALVATAGKGGRIEIPHTLPEEYRLKIVVQRVIPANRSISIGLVGGGRPFDAAIGYSSRGSALNVLDGKEITANETYVKGQFLKPRDPVEIECRVNKAGVIIIVDGRTIIDWKGDFSRLTSIRLHRNPKFLSLTVGSPFRFSKIELSPLGTSKPKPQVIDLLKKIDPQRDAIKGKWALEDGVLSTTGAEPSYIIITNHAPREYELRLTVTRSGALNQSSHFVTGLSGGSRQFRVLLDVHRDREWISGLDKIDGKEFLLNQTTRKSSQLLKFGVESKIVYRVDRQGVKVAVDGKPVIDWQGDFSRLSLHSRALSHTSKQLYIGSNGSFKISKIKLRPLGASQPQPTPQVVNLLKLIDPQRDAISGKWALENGVLLSGGGKYSRLMITTDLPKEYELRLSVTRTGTMKQASWFGMTLTGGGSQFGVSLDYVRGWTSSMSLVDGKPIAGRPGDRGPHLKIGVESQIVYRVDRKGVKVTVDGKTIIDWKGDFSRLSPRRRFKPLTNKQLRIGSYGPFKISKIELRPLGAAAAVLPANRGRIPDVAAQQKADKLIRELFKDEYAKLKRISDKLKLARKLLEQGQTTDDDAAARYVLLQKAKELSLDAGDTALTMEIVAEIIRHFDIDPFTEKLASLKKLAGSVRFTTKGKAVADAAFDVAKAALDAEQFKTSLDFAKLASSVAKKFRQRRLVKTIAEFRAKIIALKQWHDDAADASQVLALNPDDPDANLVRGRYLCFIKQDWTAGLPLLAKGDDAALKTIADLDVAAPTDAKKMTAVGNAWWDLAGTQKIDKFQKSQFLSRAGYWYGKAVGELTGLKKTLIEKRLKEIGGTAAIPLKRRSGRKIPRKTVPKKTTAKGQPRRVVAVWEISSFFRQTDRIVFYSDGKTDKGHEWLIDGKKFAFGYDSGGSLTPSRLFAVGNLGLLMRDLFGIGKAAFDELEIEEANAQTALQSIPTRLARALTRQTLVQSRLRHRRF